MSERTNPFLFVVLKRNIIEKWMPFHLADIVDSRANARREERERERMWVTPDDVSRLPYRSVGSFFKNRLIKSMATGDNSSG